LVTDSLREQGFDALKWDLVFQSRSGPPQQSWLGPDVCDFMQTVKQRGAEYVVVMPIGFLSDHMEVVYDLDTEAQQVCGELGLKMYRAKTVGIHPQFIDMIVDLICERMSATTPVAIGNLPAWHDVCPENCCLPGARTSRPAETTPTHSTNK
jgi:ferrochelatase